MKLRSVYQSKMAPAFLYEMMKERKPSVNISHKNMPTFEAHYKFIQGNPYRYWYVIEVEDRFVGYVYLTFKNEVGLFIAKRHQRKGYGKRAIAQFRKKHRIKQMLANVNPSNRWARDFWLEQGFKLIQVTYELRT